MRVASTQYHATMNRALHEAAGRVEHVMQQMASGMRVLLPSDDPITSVRLSRLSREEALLTQYRDNIAALDTRLRRNEFYMQGMVNDLQDARELLVWALDGANTSPDLNAMAGSFFALRDSLLSAANAQDQEGRYQFSGTLTSTPAVSYDPAAPVGSRYTFTGNDVRQQVMVGNGITQPANVSLPELAAVLNHLEAAEMELRAPGASPNIPASRAVLAAALVGVDDAMAGVSGKIAASGGAQNIIDTLDNNHANVSLSNKQAYLSLGQLDYGDAAVKLNGYTVALQATQKAYARIIGLSLFDVI